MSAKDKVIELQIYRDQEGGEFESGARFEAQLIFREKDQDYSDSV